MQKQNKNEQLASSPYELQICVSFMCFLSLFDSFSIQYHLFPSSLLLPVLIPLFPILHSTTIKFIPLQFT